MKTVAVKDLSDSREPLKKLLAINGGAVEQNLRVPVMIQCPAWFTSLRGQKFASPETSFVRTASSLVRIFEYY
jgi:hypothetical protein